MAPARSSTRRAQIDQNAVSHPSVSESDNNGNVNEELFLDPMLGTPLAIYIEKDVEDRDVLVELISKFGGTISPGYSGVPYILVDPHKSSGQNLYRQYAGKKGKIVLNARWIHECVKAGQLQTFHSNWAGCKVTGNESMAPSATEIQSVGPTSAAVVTQTPTRRRGRQGMQVDQIPRQIQSAHTLPVHPQSMHPPAIPSVDPLVHAQNPFPYQVYGPTLHGPPRVMHPATAAPPQTWQAPNGIAPQQTHIAPPQPHILHRAQAYREDAWDGYDHAPHPADAMGGTATTGYDYRYRDDQTSWVGGASDYYNPSYDHTYDQSTNFIDDPTSSTNAGSSTIPDPADKPRGRKRTRMQSTPAAPASTLVLNRNPPARSPTPPTRVIKSTYGGNLFTSDDVLYLKKYIDYCQEQGLVLSLREICERIAIKAPHHTFYSWRRYCNKHQIRLGGYTMNPDRSISPNPEGDQDIEDEVIHAGPGPGTIAAAQQRVQVDVSQPRNHSPTPPRALFRSTTGKGVAFTDEDVTFLVRFMEYRKLQGRLDMVAFWKDVALKAPHHSRASWMKFWRRHKHELNRAESDDPLPQPPDKKMRYSRDDDILLAKYFCNKPEGTSDKIFQAFGRMHPHHPWKGWQEHHRIHKAKIDHFIQQLANGETLDAVVQPTGAE